MDWQRFVPVDRATLLFVVKEGRILLIYKKRGLGAGKINGPGGRLEQGETPEDGARREVQEELGAEPLDIQPAGELSFQFVDGYSIHVYVFRASELRGEAVETDEAVPLWTPIDQIPYERMWADDRMWLPLLLSGEPFVGHFEFDGDRMLSHDLRRAGSAA